MTTLLCAAQNLYSFISSKVNYRRLLCDADFTCSTQYLKGKITAQYNRGNLKLNIHPHSQEDLTIIHHSEFLF